MKANLHVHTTNSDGTKTVEEINSLALQNHFDCVAITDHDTVEAIDEIKKLDTPVNFIIGVEMTCQYNNENIHILGYFGEDVPLKVRNYFRNESVRRVERCKKIIHNLQKFYNLEINYNDVKRKADGVIARPHIALAICEKYGCSYKEAFEHYIGDNNKAYVPCEVPSLEDAIKFLKDNGALVSLAHPIRISTFDYEEILDKGFDGIEVYHPDQCKEIRGGLFGLAYYYNLIVTGGSDYHGDIISTNFEDSYIDEENIDAFFEGLQWAKIKSKQKVKKINYKNNKIPIIL